MCANETRRIVYENIGLSKFESALSQGRPITFLCGAGLSVSLGDHAKGGLVGLRKANACLSDVEAEELDRRFGSYSASELIDAASFLIEALRKNGNYTAYMDSTIAVSEYRIKVGECLALFVRCGIILRQRTMISFWRKLPVWVIIHIICREK